MKKIVIVMLVLTMTVIGAYAQDNQETKLTNYAVGMSFAKVPPTVGVNDFVISLKDRHGNPIPDANITVSYYMTEQRSATAGSIVMPQHGAKSSTEFEASLYKSKIDFTMPGPWIMSVKIDRGELSEVTDFKIEVK